MGNPFYPPSFPTVFCECGERLFIQDRTDAGEKVLASASCDNCGAGYDLTFNVRLELERQVEEDPLDGANRAQSEGRSGEDGPACFWL